MVRGKLNSWALLLCLVIPSIAACGGRGLSREAAVAALTSGGGYPLPEKRMIRRQVAKMDSDGHLFLLNWFAESGEEAIPDISHFADSGLLTSEPTGQRGNVFEYVNLTLTETAKQYELPSDDQNSIAVKLCDSVLGDITGIQANEEAGAATVEYTIKRANWTPFGEYYRKSDPGSFPEVLARRATFTRYDDGWRVTKLNANSSE
jgi:hypothetical protein